jgi:hypothetical protein
MSLKMTSSVLRLFCILPTAKTKFQNPSSAKFDVFLTMPTKSKRKWRAGMHDIDKHHKYDEHQSFTRKPIKMIKHENMVPTILVDTNSNSIQAFFLPVQTKKILTTHFFWFPTRSSSLTTLSYF